MAKKKTTHVLHMPIPAKFGFSILAIAVMVYGLFLASMYTTSKQTQTVHTNAYFCTGTCPRGYIKTTCYHGRWLCLRPSPTQVPHKR
ncbi:MAG TPA: hypothetical protein VLF93_06690 [Candidatus Saccharimonadales bacterium]|nr:hypothetical protein [Candidatus Saccharimonadales bacterium]